MDDDYTREFGRIERIVDADYVNGQLFSTRFEMRIFSTNEHQYINKREYFEFYGPIPEEYIGLEAMFFKGTTEIKQVSRESCSIRVGKIKSRRTPPDGTYDIVPDDELDPNLPSEIRSQFLKRVNDFIVWPYCRMES
tara:strand:- start:6401 stop:6811 length:411 start_codon:yes stop_codon:yes gene_type:complete